MQDTDGIREWLARDWDGALHLVESGLDRVVEVEDLYVDTADGALEHAGFGARLRRVDGGPVTITVKSASHEPPSADGDPGPSGPRALTRRLEVEGRADERLDPDRWPPSAARELVNEVRGRARLRIRFTIRQRREQRTLALDDGPVEVTLDGVKVFRGSRPLSSFSVLEVEAPTGSGVDLSRLAPLIEDTGYVVPEPRSKEEIARDYVAKAAEDHARRLPVVPKSPGVTADDTLGEAGIKVLRMHLARMLHNEAGARSGADIDDLHKMRVATRRMRAAWRVFDGAYRPKVQRRYVHELRTIARALGDVRDLDVLLRDLDSYIEELPAQGREALEPLRSAWCQQREVARRHLIARLDSKGYSDFVEDYLEFTESPGSGEVLSPLGQERLVRDTAGSRILAAYERVRAYDTTMSWADVPTLHALRIECKRLRYTMENFSEVLPVTSGKLVEQVTDVQGHLGLLNDADVAATATRRWLDQHAPQLPARSREAVGLYLGLREADVERLLRSFKPVWRRITGPTFRQALGIAITRIG